MPLSFPTARKNNRWSTGRSGNRPLHRAYLDTATAVFSLSHDPPSAVGPGRTRSLGSLLRRTGEGVPVLRSSHNSVAGAWGNTAEGGGEGVPFRQSTQTGHAQRPPLRARDRRAIGDYAKKPLARARQFFIH